MLIYPFWWFL